MRPKGRAKASGGIVEKAYTGNVLRIVNAQSALGSDVLADLVQRMRYGSQLPIELTSESIPSGETPMGFSSAKKRVNGVGALVVMIDDANYPIILSSPDGHWSILNVAALKGDETKFVERLKKVLWGAVARSIGAGSTADKGCVLAPYSNVKELDALNTYEPSPMSHNIMLDVAKASGMNTLFFATYRTACQQGWAHAPTNDVQKAIWQEVHAVPAAPMKIEFDPKKGR